MVNKSLIFAGILLLLFFFCDAQSFVHPGILHSREDLQRMKQAVAAREEPIFAGYHVFIQNPASAYDYKLQGPLETVSRNPTAGQATYDNDANAAHQNAVMWVITGDKRHADKAIEIVNAWSSTLKSITGRDAVLMAGLGPFKMINAAEILRYTNTGWKQEDIIQAEKHFKKVIYPVIKSYAPFANGNWEAAAMKTVMAIGVFCNERSMFEDVLKYYTYGGGNGRLTNYVINETGQVQESGRDQPHSQLGIAMLAECCAIAWNQGLDLYSFADNRLLKGFEYTAKYNLGHDDLPFQEWLDRTGKYHHLRISDMGRGALRAVYEQVYNHYVKRMGRSAPYTQQAAEKLRPEGPGKPGADHPGYGTLYFTIQAGRPVKAKAPAAPAAINVKTVKSGIELNWLPPVDAVSYTVKRSTRQAGPFTSIGQTRDHSSFVDNTAKSGAIYYYRITAANTNGKSADSYITAAFAGLPGVWKQTNRSDAIKGNTSFDGKKFTVVSTGYGVDSNSEQSHLTYQSLAGDGEITIRYLPQLTSQFTSISLNFQEDLSANSPGVWLILGAGKTGQVEAPIWNLSLMTKKSTGEKSLKLSGENGLSEPAVTHGRLTGHLWLRLQRKADSFTAYHSYDGKKWLVTGNALIHMRKNVLIGFSVASGMVNSTVVSFDHVEVK